MAGLPEGKTGQIVAAPASTEQIEHCMHHPDVLSIHIYVDVENPEAIYETASICSQGSQLLSSPQGGTQLVPLIHQHSASVALVWRKFLRSTMYLKSVSGWSWLGRVVVFSKATAVVCKRPEGRPRNKVARTT